jgi:DNA-binding NtrC family response regulator
MCKPTDERAPSKPVILVVEEENAVRNLLELALERQGFHVLAAASGQEALDTYQALGDSIDLVLMDVRMEGMDGPQTFSKLQGINPAIRCCLMSGDTALNNADQSLPKGVLHIFRKPFLSLNDLGRKLRECLP